MRLAAAALALVLAGGPAFAWDYEERHDGAHTLAGAWQNSESGYQLAIECDDAYADPDLYLFTPEIFVGQSDDAVPLAFTVDGRFFGPIYGAVERSDGRVAIAVRAYEEDRLGALLRRLLQARSGIELRYRSTQLQFGTDRVLSVMSRLIDTCSGLAASK
jgi:hypothetical protein